MNTKAIGIGIVAIIIVITMVVVYDTIRSDTWESPWTDDEGETPSGMTESSWGQEIIIEYADGTMQSLKPVFDSKILSMSHQGKFVVAIHYVLKGKASGDIGIVEVDVSEFRYTFEIERVGTVHWTRTYNPSLLLTSSIIPLDVDGAWHEILYRPHTITELQAICNSVEDGSYSLWLKPQGSLTYRVPGGSWTTGTLPSEVGFTVTTRRSGNGGQGGTIVVEFDSGYRVY